jgi:EAL domain-containing protein (putative c-di-GMP-specific phosphodiesterase class I)
MDDFGTGFSNLASLHTLPIDLLKIDRSFVTGMLTDRDQLAIVRAILGLSKALGMDTVAEGIETVELGQTLGALGCTFGQGYAYARPLDADAAYDFLVARNA